MTDDLSNLSAADIDSLPFGFIGLAPDGTVRKYNRYEADLARKDPQEVLGRNFFRDVAPCTQVQEFEGRFREFASGEISEPTLSFDFEFAFRHARQKVRIGFVRTPLASEIVVTVNRVRDLDLSTSTDLSRDATRGLVFDDGGQGVVIANADLFLAIDDTFCGRAEDERRQLLHRLGKEWGHRHALRVERFVQRRYGQALREVELQAALEGLSGSVGAMGLGRFEVDLRYRQRGLLLVLHRDSPFDAFHSDRDGARNGLLAGLHAGFLSYLSGRDLAGREIEAARRPDRPCRILVGTERRLERLFDPAPGSPDADLLVALGMLPARPARPEIAEVGKTVEAAGEAAGG
jgi:photoactive yellow protein